jgi:restriction endonuclease S subunit
MVITARDTKLKPGYKQTELGIIPMDWEIYSLSQCAKRITDGEHLTPKRSASGYYLLSARNILNGRIDLSDVDYVDEDEYRRIRNRCNPEPGDVLISCSGTVGRVATVPEGLKCVMVRSAALVKPDPEMLSGLFLQYFLQSTAGQKQILASLNQGAQANLFQNHIRELRILIPSTKAEQEAISTVLSDTDALIECLEKLIAKKRDIKQAAMQQLLTGKTRLPGFGGEWEVKKLGEIGEKFVNGGTPSTQKQEYWQGNIPWITGADVINHWC